MKASSSYFSCYTDINDSVLYVREMKKVEWMEALKKAIAYIEDHLLEEISVEDIAKEVYLSPFYFQKGFKIITGYTIGEYVRNRRLYLAALELTTHQEVRVIDMAYKYGYDTPESFTKAFTRFHGKAPMQLKEQGYELTPFYPLQLEISIKGGDRLDVRIEEMLAFKVKGIERTFNYETAFNEIPRFWEEYRRKQLNLTDEEWQSIGCFGICIDEQKTNKEFRYLLAGPYREGEIETSCEVKVVTIPAFTRAKFKSIGPMPQAIQNLNLRIFKEWLPGNAEYEIAEGYNIELYTKGDILAPDYVSEIWIPVRRK